VLTQRADPLDASLRTLVVTGTPGNDKMLFNPSVGASGSVKVLVNKLPQGTFSPSEELIAYGEEGDDDIQVARGINLPALLHGGVGDDQLTAGGGQNLLLGGLGADILSAGKCDDLLIAGTTAFDADEATLTAILAEWTSGRDYSTRIANLHGTGTGPRSNGDSFLEVSGSDATVFDDGAIDVLNGGPAMDWFLASQSQDILRGQHISEIIE
jgi:Ca2+-binding RTX toxin-like protein